MKPDIRAALSALVLVVCLMVGWHSATAADAPEAFLNQHVDMTGSLEEMIDVRCFLMVDPSGVFDEDRVLVIDGTADGLDLDNLQALEGRVLVSGTIRDLPYVMDTLGAQLGYEFDAAALEPYALLPVVVATNATTPILVTPSTLGDSADYGDLPLAVSGDLAEVLGERVFLLQEDELMGDGQVLVVDGSAEPLSFVAIPGTQLLVAGTLHDVNYVLDDLAAALDFTFNNQLLADYRDRPLLVATSVVNLDDVSTIEHILDDPEAFLGQPVVLEGGVMQRLSGDTFVLAGFSRQPDGLLPVIGITPQASLDQVEGHFDRLIVRGTVRMLDVAALENEFGVQVSEAELSEFVGGPAIVAAQVVPADDVVSD